MLTTDTCTKQIMIAEILPSESVSRLIIDANRNHSPLTLGRLMNWHCLIFDGVAKGFSPKHIGAFRTGTIYVVHSKQREFQKKESVLKWNAQSLAK